MIENQPVGLGTFESNYDARTRRHDTTLAMPLTTGGVRYIPSDIGHQHFVGICTAISMVQNAEKALGKKFSPDFQYMMQKRMYDINWDEGSSIFNALKVATKKQPNSSKKEVGFLPIEKFADLTGRPYIVENDRFLPYDQYISKLQAIPPAEIDRLISLCTDRLEGYAQLATDAQSLAKGILDSKSGILCRYVVGKEWWTSTSGAGSYDPKDIDPLRPPAVPISGHAIIASYFDYTNKPILEHPNTWGITWNMQGVGHIDHSVYQCTEAWIPYYNNGNTPPPTQYQFNRDLHYGETSEDVRQLQIRLGLPAQLQTGYFGDITRAGVLAYQDAKHIPLTFSQRWIAYYCVVGPMTRAALNSK